MSTDPPKDIKTLSFRISRQLWIRIGDAARRLGVTTQELCTRAVEEHLSRLAGKKSADDVNGKNVRSILGDIKKSSQGGS
jgi:hypothetical protein